MIMHQAMIYLRGTSRDRSRMAEGLAVVSCRAWRTAVFPLGG